MKRREMLKEFYPYQPPQNTNKKIPKLGFGIPMLDEQISIDHRFEWGTGFNLQLLSQEAT
jgi:hypothetical protein